MKGLFVQATEEVGGAAIAASDLYQELRRIVELDQLCMYTSNKQKLFYPKYIAYFRTILEKLLTAMTFRSQYASLNIVPSNITQRLNSEDYDFIHFHWPHLGMVTVKDISRLQQPLFWTCHDLWAILGSHHYPLEGNQVLGFFENKRRI